MTAYTPDAKLLRNGDLDLSGDRDIIEIAAFPAGTRAAFLGDCTRLGKIHSFNPELEVLHISRCSSLRQMATLPKGMKVVHAGLCWSLEQFQDLDSYDKMRLLDVSGCWSLGRFPKLSSSIKSFYGGNCKKVVAMPDLPAGLEVLDMRYSDWLTGIEALPPRLRRLFVRGCKNLPALPAVPATLEFIDVAETPFAHKMKVGPTTQLIVT